MGTLNTGFCPSSIPVLPWTWLLTTVDRTEVRAIGRRTAVEKKGSRIKQECRLLHLPLNRPENPRYGREVYEMWKTWTSTGEKCAAKNAKCKECHKIGHFYKVCQSSKRTRRANLAQATLQDVDDTHIDECGFIQPNPPVVNMLKVINHTGATSGTQGSHTQRLKFPIDVDPREPYKHHLEVRVDTGADVNCMNEKTFRKLFLKWSFLYVPTIYRTLETQQQTFTY